MRNRWLLIIATTTAITACKNDKQPPPTPGSTVPVATNAAPGEATAATATTADPSASAAAAFAGPTLAGFSTVGSDLELPAGAHAAVPAGTGAKVDVGGIAAAPADDLPVQSFAGVSTLRGFRVAYLTSKDEVHETIRGSLEKSKVFESLTESLNTLVRVPRSIDVHLVDCGTVNAFYDPMRKRIIVCYELMTYFTGVFGNAAKKAGAELTPEKLGAAVMGATEFAFFHEVGHGLIDVLKLPAVGREEDAVDQLAALILIGGGDEGVGMAMAGAFWFKIQHDAGEDHTPFSDEHAFDGQRYYNILCLVYGSNPRKYEVIAKSGLLPADRARQCPAEYKQISKAWEMLLQPHLANRAAVRAGYKPAIDPAETEGDESVDANPNMSGFDGGDGNPATTAAAGSAAPASGSSTKLGGPPSKAKLEGCEKLKQTVAKPKQCAALAVEIAKLDCTTAGAFAEAQRISYACFDALKDRLAELRVAARPNSCEKVSAHARRLMLHELVEQSNTANGGSAKLRTRIDAELPAFQEALLAACAQKPWSDADRDCVLKAKTLADARTSCKM